MGDAKRIIVKPIAASDARALVRQWHYSGKVVNNSQVHLGAFLDGKCGGVMQFGPSLDKRKLQGLVSGTLWNEFIELNRMAFADWMPRNGESRCLAVAFRLLRKQYPHLKWVVSFADATQCGDGTIYRASGFVLTGIASTPYMVRLPSGEVVHRVTWCDGGSRLSAEVKEKLGGAVRIHGSSGGCNGRRGFARPPASLRVLPSPGRAREPDRSDPAVLCDRRRRGAHVQRTEAAAR